MKKRKQYRPKHVLVNPIGYVLESMTPVAKYDDYLIDLKIKNHGALAALTQGRAVRDDMRTLTAMINVTVALSSMGIGADYNDDIAAGRTALLSIAERGKDDAHYIVRGPEMGALNVLIDLHDAQMDAITIKHIEKAIAIVHAAARQGRFERLG